MKRIIPLLLLVASVSLHATPPSPQSVEQLATLAKVDKIRDAVLVQMDKGLDSGIKRFVPAGQALTPADEAVLAACRVQIVTLIDQQLSAAKLRAMYQELYAETFTQEEVDGLITFYSSPVGKVFAEKLPDLNEKIGLKIQQGLTAIGMQLQGSMMSAAMKIQHAHAPKAAPKPAVPAAATPAPAKPAAPAVAPSVAPAPAAKTN